MAIAMRVRAGNGEIKILMTHPSENGLRKDAKTGQLVPAHFIKNVTVAVNGKTVLDGQWGGGVSKDPYLSFKVKGMKAGDKIAVNAEDNKGDKGSAEAGAS
ncbi:MAG: thiosulfate oxidation carrier complex protein SoxZ [Thiobacillaceae bacterium]|nr:thiosulfate oxidation carrier complex protein SoxZ [Thiobacillaceae bacterium]